MEGEVSNGTTTWAWTGLSVLVVLAVGVALLSGTAAADDGIGIDRNGSEITVTAGSPAYNGTNATEANVTVGSVTRTVELGNGSANSGTIAISEFRGADVNFANATVIVGVNDTNDAKTLDLRVLRLGENDPAPGQPLTFGVEQVGVGSQPLVRVTDGSSSMSVRAVRKDGSVRVPMERVRNGSVEVLGSVTVTTLPRSNWSHRRTVDLRSVSRAWFRSRPDGATLAHPLVVASADYEVTIRTTGPEGTFTATRQARRGEFGGRLDVPGEVVFASSRNVTVQRASDGRVVTKNVTGSLLQRTTTTTARLNGTVFVDADRLVASPTRLWVRGSRGTVAALPRDAYDADTGQLRYASASVNDSTELTVLAANDSATSAVRLVSESANTSGSGASAQTTTSTDTPNGTQNATAFGTNLSFVQFLRTFIPGFISVVLGAILLGVGLSGEKRGFVMGGLLVVGLGLFTMVILWSQQGYTGQAILTIVAALLSTVGVGAIRYVTLKLQDASRHVSLESLMIPAVIVVSLLVVAAVGVFNVLPWIPVWPVTGGLYGTLLVTSVTVLTEWPPLEGSTTPSGSPGPGMGGRSTPQPETYDTRIRVVDHAGDPIDDEVPVALERELGGTQRDRIVGEGTVALQEGTYTITAEYAGQTDVARRIRPSSQQGPVILQFEGRTLAVTARDSDDGSPVADATVEATTDNGEELRGETDSRGRWERTVDVSVQRVDVSVDHERYETATATVDPSATNSVDVEMRPLTGTVAVSARLDGRSLPDTNVELRSSTAAVDVSRTGTTGDDGSVTFEDVPIGDYEVEPVDVPSAYAFESVRTTVEDRQTSKATVTFRFEYDLPTSTRNRVDDLRSAASSITDTNRDAAIQRYYVTVVHQVLDAVERVPSAGYPLLVHGIDPDDLATALLDAAERATETVEEVMNSKRNVDLFTACRDLPDANVTWSGDVTVEEVLDVAERDVSQQRTDIIDRLESVDDRIDDEQASLQEVSPAREMRDGIRDLVREQQGTTDLSFAATTVVAEALLDAIDELFEHDPLRTRMERTVY